MNALIAETKKDGYTYKRFHDREDLKPLMRDALHRLLADEFRHKPTADEVNEGEQLVESASAFESTVLTDANDSTLDQDLLQRFNQHLSANAAAPSYRSGGEALHARGLAVRSDQRTGFHPTAAALLLFGKHPANRFPQSEILADAYDGVLVTGRPKGQAVINAPLPHALEQVLQFIDDHTFHPHRVVGLNNLRLDEYPVPALREALVNAVAHRSYEDASRKIFLRIFSDRIEVASPGYPLKPLTLARLRKGSYRPCSRNPMIAQTLATLMMMEQRGTGFARMRDAMLNHGLDEPVIAQQDGFFIVTLPGPAGDFDRIRTPEHAGGRVTPAVEAQLNERQKRMVRLLAAGESLTSRRCEADFGITRDTATRDFALLLQLGIAIKVGRGRSVHYLRATPG